MGLQIIIQPNERLCVWDSISSSIIMWDGTTDEVVEFMVERERARIKDEVATIVAKLRNHKKAYYQFTMSWAEAIKAMREQHGWEAVGEILDSMEPERVPS